MRKLLVSCLFLSLSSCGRTIEPRTPATAPSGAEAVGPGFLAPPESASMLVATDAKGKPISPKVTSSFSQVPVSNKWWSSLIWQFHGDNPYSLELYAHPLVFKANAAGLGLSYPSSPMVLPREYMHRYSEDVVVSLDGLRSPDARVASYSDWTVTAEWRAGASALRATIGHGFPFAYFEREGSAPALVLANPSTVLSNKGPVVAFTVSGRHYALFAPGGASWERTDRGFRSDLGGKKYFSVAALPNTSGETLDEFRRHAYAFVRDTSVRFTYDAANASLDSTFELRSEAMESQEGLSSEPLIALYRHQWLHSSDQLLSYEYSSPRGVMKTRVGNSFRTRTKFSGILPVLPKQGDVSLRYDVRAVFDQPDLFPVGLGERPDRDAYWEGKNLGKLANVAQIAAQEGMADVRDGLVQALKNEIEDWFDGREPRAFRYERRWASLVGSPPSYGSARELNDHHFHYGYFVFAAAIVARFDPAWAQRWKPCIDLLIGDAANSKRDNPRFPFLRHMDVYAGHSWANGPAQFADGNNEESVSEDINLSSALVLWGALTGDKSVRDLGIFLYQNQVIASEQYWFDVDRAVFPKGFDTSAVGMVWGAGAKYDTWFDQDPLMIHGINLLPFHGGSLYLGRRADHVKRNFDEVLKKSHGKITTWRDYFLMYLAVADPGRAVALFEDDTHFLPEFGGSMAMTRHWIYNLQALGTPDTSVTANVPTYAVFVKGGTKTHVAFNPEASPRMVKFSDGVHLSVPAGALVSK